MAKCDLSIELDEREMPRSAALEELAQLTAQLVSQRNNVPCFEHVDSFEIVPRGKGSSVSTFFDVEEQEDRTWVSVRPGTTLETHELRRLISSSCQLHARSWHLVRATSGLQLNSASWGTHAATIHHEPTEHGMDCVVP